MAIIVNGIDVKKINFGNTEIKQVNVNGNPVWYAGNNVTYVVSGIEYVEFVEFGQDCLHPSVVDPVLDDAVFLGWTDDPENATPLDEKIMSDNPITLYAIFKYNNKITTRVGAGGKTVWSSAVYYDVDKYEKIGLKQNQNNSGSVVYSSSVRTSSSASTAFITVTNKTEKFGTPTASRNYVVGATSTYASGWPTATMTYYGKTVVG